MPHPLRRAVPVATLLIASLLPASLAAQTDGTADGQSSRRLKSFLMGHYAGRSVRPKVAIPRGARGLEIIDGRLAPATSAARPAAAHPGETLLIERLKFTGRRIEVQLSREEAGAEGRAAWSGRRFPLTAYDGPAARLSLRFRRKIAADDLTVANIDRLLEAAVDLTASPPQAAGRPPISTATAESRSLRLSVVSTTDSPELPVATAVGDLPAAESGVGELTVECSTGRARVYLDGSFSGWTPRTVKVLAGPHTVLVIADGHGAWEQRFFIPGGKASLVRAELKRAGERER